MPYPKNHYIYPQELKNQVEELAKQCGSKSKLSKRWDITKQFLDYMLNGQARWQPRFLREMGWERVTIYRRIEK